MTCTEELQKTSGKFVRCFGYREFCRLWSEVVPFIRTMPPAEDIHACLICQENATRIMQSANCSEDEKGTFYWQRKSISSVQKAKAPLSKASTRKYSSTRFPMARE